MMLYREASDRLRVRLNMYPVEQ